MTRSQLLAIPTLLLLAAAATTGCGGKAPAPAAPSAAKPAGTSAAEKPAAPLPADLTNLQPLAKPANAGASAAAAPGTPSVPPSSADAAAGSPNADPAAAGAVLATGEFTSPVTSELVVKLPGRVGKMYVDEGDAVRKGQPLLALESDYWALDLKRAEADVARAKASEADAGRDFKRKQVLVDKGSVAQSAFDRSQASSDAAKAGTESAVAARDLARQKLDDAVLRSPIDGVIAEKKTDVGQRLGDNSVAFVIAQTSPLKLRFRVPERYLAAVRQGQTVKATIDPYPGRVFTGRVTQLGRVVDTATRTVVVESEFQNQDSRYRLLPGLFARVELDLSGPAGGGGAVKAPAGSRQGAL